MPLYLISYDLHAAPESRYVALAAELKRLNARKVLDSQWLLINTAPAMALVTALIQHVTPNDRIFVTEITRKSAWRGTLMSSEDLRAWFAHARG